MANFADLWESSGSDAYAGLKADFASRLESAKQAYKQQFGKDLPITSGFRTTEEQAKLYANRGSNPNLVAAPGTSKHEVGNAADIPAAVPDSFLNQFGLHRPFGKKDPVHVEANPNFKPQATATTQQTTTQPSSSNFADLWESAPVGNEPKAEQMQQTKQAPKNIGEAAVSANQTMQPFVQGAASLADTTIGGILPFAAKQASYAIGRAVGQTPTEAETTSNKLSSMVDKPFGKALGITETSGYKGEASQRLMEFISENVGKGADWIAQKTGLPVSDVANMIGTATIAAGKGVEAVKPAMQATSRFLKEREFTPAELQARQNLQPQGGASVGAAQAANESIVKEAITRASPQVAQELSRLNPNEVSIPALERVMDADTLPIPIQLTKGQTTRNPKIFSDEMNSRAKNPQLADRYNQQNAQLVENINAIKEKASPDVYGTNVVENGQSLIDSYLDLDKIRTADIDAKYQTLRDAAGGEIPIDAAKFADNAYASLKKNLKTEFLPSSIKSQLDAFKGGAPMTFEQFEAMRTNLASEMRKADRAGDGNAEFALSKVREALEDLPLVGESKDLKILADSARSAAKQRFDLISQDKAYKAAINGNVAPDDFIQKFVVNGKKGDIDTMVNHLGVDSQARQVMAAGIVNWLKSKSGILSNDTGTFSQKGFNKALESIDPKILNIVGPEVNQQLKALGNTARNIQERPAGAYVNESNTFTSALGEKAANVVEKGANYFIGGGVVPVGTMTRNAVASVKEGAKAKESLKPAAGIKLKDIGKQ
jgi:hypothetical protein